MGLRKLGIVVALSLVALGLTAPGAQAQLEPEVYAPVAVCLFFGQIVFSDGIVISTTVEPPEDEQGTYAYVNSSVVCAGVVTGTCPMFSSGNSQPDGTFSGTFTIGSCSLTGQSCTGQIGGPGGTPNPDGPFSMVLGTIVVASVDELACSSFGALPGLSDGDGLIAGVAAPNPSDTPTCEDAATPPPAIVLCSVLVAGVGVFLQEVPPDAP
ncbi:MAG: hypothetical protein QOF60_2075 [Actinomycetota bacterium]|nr:hypothetical protein [Actinomycetota bacterium]